MALQQLAIKMFAYCRYIAERNDDLTNDLMKDATAGCLTPEHNCSGAMTDR